MTRLLLIPIGLTNLISYVLMGIDKFKARRHRWRLPEKVLFLFPLLMGAPGGLAGMLTFRHKTRKWYFRWGLPVLAAAQLVVIALIALF